MSDKIVIVHELKMQHGEYLSEKLTVNNQERFRGVVVKERGEYSVQIYEGQSLIRQRSAKKPFTTAFLEGSYQQLIADYELAGYQVTHRNEERSNHGGSVRQKVTLMRVSADNFIPD